LREYDDRDHSSGEYQPSADVRERLGDAVSAVWLTIPSIRPNGGTIPLWRERGYRVAVLRQGERIEADLCIPTDHYLGWAKSINTLVSVILGYDPDAQWICAGGDDTLPDDHAPDEIARECTEHFGGTFGVMQPTGDLKLWPGSAIDKFAGSPWMGREFCDRMYGGTGPLWGGYYHMHADEELQNVATKLGVFWQRPDLIHKHMHWGRRPGGARREDIPDFLQYINTMEHWNEAQSMFNQRKAAGWPGHEPMAL
jgi:biotin operon repressor